MNNNFSDFIFEGQENTFNDDRSFYLPFSNYNDYLHFYPSVYNTSELDHFLSLGTQNVLSLPSVNEEATIEGASFPIGMLSSANSVTRTNSIQLPFLSPRHSMDGMEDILQIPSYQFGFVPFEEPNQADRAYENSEVVFVDNIPSEDTATDTVVNDPLSVPLVEQPVENVEQEQSSDDEWISGMNTAEIHTGKGKPVMWTADECERLREAVKLYGAAGSWSKIAKYVGTRSSSQCINKWKNDLCKNKKRWNREATNQLAVYLKKGLTEEEIAKKMSDYTYIQIYQQIRKFNSNQDPWEDWEIRKLAEYKKEGILTNTQIGGKLNNRHCDAVKNMWNRIKQNYK